MTAIAASAAAFQLLIVLLLWRRSRRVGGGHIAAMFATAWFLFSGLARLTLSATPGRWHTDVYQPVTVASLDRWMVWSTVQLAAYGAAVLAWWRWRGHAAAPPAGEPATHIRPITARRCAGALAVLFPALIFPSSSFVGGLAMQFSVFLIALAVIDLSLRRPRRTLLYVAAGCGLMTLFGQRLQLVSVAVLALGSLLWLGRSVPKRRLILAACGVAVLVSAIAGGRQVSGRETLTESGVAGRAGSLLGGLRAGVTWTSMRAQFDDMAGRLDGNAFGAVVLTAQRDEGHHVGAATIRNSLALSVPSFLYHAKLDQPVWDRSEKAYFLHFYDLSLQQDFIPGWGAVVSGWWGPFTAAGITGCLGVALAGLDLWLRRRSVIGLIVALHVAYGICLFERGPEGFLLILRGAIPLVVVFAYLKVLHMGAAARRSRPVASGAVHVHRGDRAADARNLGVPNYRLSRETGG